MFDGGGLVLRIKNIGAMVVLYFMIIMVCMLYAALFVRLITEFIVLDGWAFNALAGLVFIIQLVIGIRYGVPDLKPEVLEVTTDFKEPPMAVFYYNLIAASMLSTFFIMMFVEEFLPLEGVTYLGVTVLVFLIALFCFFVRVKKRDSRSG